MTSTKSARPQIRTTDAGDPERLRAVLNEILLDLVARIETLEESKGITQLDDVQFDTGATIAAGVKPFDGSMRVNVPFSPTGLVLLRIQRIRPAGQPAQTSAVQLSWRYLGGPNSGNGAVVIDFISGLAANSSYVMRLGVTRG